MASATAPAAAPFFRLEPDKELEFQKPFNQTIRRMLVVRNTLADAPIAFKVKTTAPKQYLVRPNAGRIAPGAAVEIQVLLQPTRDELPPEYKCKDKFLVQGIRIDHAVMALEGAPLAERFAELWAAAELRKKEDPASAAHFFCERKLRCAFLEPSTSSAGAASTTAAPASVSASSGSANAAAPAAAPTPQPPHEHHEQHHEPPHQNPLTHLTPFQSQSDLLPTAPAQAPVQAAPSIPAPEAPAPPAATREADRAAAAAPTKGPEASDVPAAAVAAAPAHAPSSPPPPPSAAPMPAEPPVAAAPADATAPLAREGPAVAPIDPQDAAPLAPPAVRAPLSPTSDAGSLPEVAPSLAALPAAAGAPVTVPVPVVMDPEAPVPAPPSYAPSVQTSPAALTVTGGTPASAKELREARETIKRLQAAVDGYKAEIERLRALRWPQHRGGSGDSGIGDANGHAGGANPLVTGLSGESMPGALLSPATSRGSPIGAHASLTHAPANDMLTLKLAGLVAFVSFLIGAMFF